MLINLSFITIFFILIKKKSVIKLLLSGISVYYCLKKKEQIKQKNNE